MPRILTTCPTTNTLVPTGQRTTDLDLASFAGQRAFRCPACQEVHTWTGPVAVVEKTISLGAFRPAA